MLPIGIQEYRLIDTWRPWAPSYEYVVTVFGMVWVRVWYGRRSPKIRCVAVDTHIFTFQPNEAQCVLKLDAAAQRDYGESVCFGRPFVDEVSRVLTDANTKT